MLGNNPFSLSSFLGKEASKGQEDMLKNGKRRIS